MSRHQLVTHPTNTFTLVDSRADSGSAGRATLAAAGPRNPPTGLAVALASLLAAGVLPGAAHAQVRAMVRTDAGPAWTRGIQPISRESYWHAVECGKQGGANPACVFWDADLCKNGDFTLAFYTPYKQVAYQVWQAVSKKQAPPTPSYVEAQRTRVILGITPVRGSQNPITGVVVKRGGRVVEPATQTLAAGGGTFIFDFAAFAPTANITIEMTGRAMTVSCLVDRSVLARFR